MKQVKILIIDDENIVIRTLKNILEFEGYEVHSAQNGADGFQRVLKEDFDVIFLDLKLPDTNGIEVLKKIKSVKMDVAVIIVTGFATVESATTAIRMSAFDYILKPIDAEQIRTIVKNALKRRKVESSIRQNIPQPKILLMGRTKTKLDQIYEKFTSEAWETVKAGTGNEALNILRKDPTINAVIFELGDEHLKGTEFMAAVHGYNSEALIITYTAVPDLQEAVEIMREGAFDYLIEPVRVEDIYECLRRAWQFHSLSFMNRQLVYELEKINEKTSRSEMRVKSILSSIGEAVITTDPEGNVLSMNRVAEELTGYTFSETKGKPIQDFLQLVKDEALTPVENPICSIIKGQNSSVVLDDVFLLTRGGTTVPIAASANSIVTPDYAIIGTVLTFRNMTERKKIEQELIAKNRELDDFAFRVSHDIKSPINMIKAFVMTIEKDPVAHVSLFARLKSQTDKTVDLIDKILQLSRAGKVIEKKENINLELLLKKIYVILQSRGISLEVKLQSPLPYIDGDQASLTNLFSNMFENSVKYADPDKELLKVEISARTETDYQEIYFKDNGIGVEEKYLHDIFFPGFSLSKQYGSGFGLAICKKIATAHGGTIIAKSEGQNKGTEFVLRLPVE